MDHGFVAGGSKAAGEERVAFDPAVRSVYVTEQGGCDALGRFPWEINTLRRHWAENRTSKKHTEYTLMIAHMPWYRDVPDLRTAVLSLVQVS